jgi:hypothetical protein
MSKKLNCWEYLNCGMEPGGIFSKIHGPCPIPLMMRYDGVNGGQGAGRICWEIVSQRSQNQELFACRSSRSCVHCKFYHRVHSEQEELVTTFAKNRLKNKNVLIDK